MKRILVVLAVWLAVPPCQLRAQSSEAGSGPSLAETIAKLDEQAFAAFNRCADPAELDAHAAFFADDVEFYHDTGGVTWNRADMLANTRKYACGHFTRELVRGSLSVYPIKDFGAIEQGSHRFCQVGSTTCDGVAEFVILWHRTENGWKITRVLSYGHRAA
jgi:hypothetical protein